MKQMSQFRDKHVQTCIAFSMTNITGLHFIKKFLKHGLRVLLVAKGKTQVMHSPHQSSKVCLFRGRVMAQMSMFPALLKLKMFLKTFLYTFGCQVSVRDSVLVLSEQPTPVCLPTKGSPSPGFHEPWELSTYKPKISLGESQQCT